MTLKELLSASGALIDNRPKTIKDMLIGQGCSFLTPSVRVNTKAKVKPPAKTMGDLIKEHLSSV